MNLKRTLSAGITALYLLVAPKIQATIHSPLSDPIQVKTTLDEFSPTRIASGPAYRDGKEKIFHRYYLWEATLHNGHYNGQQVYDIFGDDTGNRFEYARFTKLNAPNLEEANLTQVSLESERKIFDDDLKNKNNLMNTNFWDTYFDPLKVELFDQTYTRKTEELTQSESNLLASYKIEKIRGEDYVNQTSAQTINSCSIELLVSDDNKSIRIKSQGMTKNECITLLKDHFGSVHDNYEDTDWTAEEWLNSEGSLSKDIALKLSKDLEVLTTINDKYDHKIMRSTDNVENKINKMLSNILDNIKKDDD